MEPEHKDSCIAVIGLGYVGLPLARTFVSGGFTVYGIDIDAGKIDKLNKRESYLSDFRASDIADMFETGRFVATDSFQAASNASSIMICVPTPIDDYDQPDLSYVTGALRSLLPHLKHGQLIVLESSTYPGTTEEELKPMIEAQGFEVGKNIHLAFSPERVDPGRNQLPLSDIPKVVGGVTEGCTVRACRLYSAVFRQVVPVANARTAEFTKLLENVQRFVNISLMNDLVALCERLDINLWDAIAAAGTKPYGFTPFYPGPGVGGHCIPVDPLYLLWKAREQGMDLPFIDLSNQINKRMPEFVVDKAERTLPQGKVLKGSSIFAVGVAYKKDVNDLRESTALRVIELLVRKGASVQYYDPYFPEIVISETKLARTDLNEDTLSSCDLTLILTDHSSVDYSFIAAHSKVVLDTRNATKGLKRRSNVVLL